MDKEWFILINDDREGPYSLLDLKWDSRVTPDTLVWKEGFKEWVALRDVAELKEIFKDEPESKPLHDEIQSKPFPELPDQEALTIQNDPSQLFLWLLVIILILAYVLYQLRHFS